MDAIREPARETPIMAEADVCVAGGSATGVCAAVAAARAGGRGGEYGRAGGGGSGGFRGLISVGAGG